MKRLSSLIAVVLTAASAACSAADDPVSILQAKAADMRRVLQPSRVRWRYYVGDVPEASQAAFDDSAWKSSDEVGFEWGTEPVAWLRTQVTIPEDAGGLPLAGGQVVFRCGIDDDGIVYVDGEERQRFHWNDCSVVLAERAEPGRTYRISIKGLNRSGPGRLLWSRVDYGPVTKVQGAIETCLRQFGLAWEVYDLLDEAKRAELAPTLAQAASQVNTDALKAGKTDEFVKSLAAATATAESALSPAKDLTIHLVGHAHIDMNWLWLWPETVDVCRNTFSTASKLMDEFPGFTFSQSQAEVYRAMEEYAPEVLTRIKDRIGRGQWEVTGTTWTESDTNMSSGEAIVRSILYGKRYLKRQFGVESKICWMPDNFGHAWTLPQILAKSGIKYYYFMRCGRNQPLFWWEGPDGSRVLAFTYGGYSGSIGDGMLLDALRFAKSTGVRDFMQVYGVGDHGGGPTRDMLEAATELQKRPDFPKIEFGKAQDYFDKVLAQKQDFPVWANELNTAFEGCYTTHGDMKRWNRECENLIPCAEEFAAVACDHGVGYPAEGFERSWQNTCFNQFHDILCGSAIHASYEYSKGLYEQVIEQAGGALETSLAALSSKIKTAGKGVPIVVFNPLAWPRTDTVEVDSPLAGGNPAVAIMDEKGTACAGQEVGDRLVFTAHEVPALGYKVFWAARAASPPATGIHATETGLENRFFRVDLDRTRGAIAGIYDKVNSRQLVPAGGATGALQVLMESPQGMSAWSIGRIAGQQDVGPAQEVDLIERGPARASFTVEHAYDKSQFVQEISLYDDVPRIDIGMTADWQELGTGDAPNPMIKVAFPTTLASPKATFEIPFGSIERPTNGAEVPAQKWIDLSEPGYGVSLLNDCKYGFDVKDNVMRMSLLRSSRDPDPTPDQGTHEIGYSLYPHKGGWREAGTVRRGRELNEPLIARVVDSHPGPLPASKSFLSVDAPNIVVTALKQAEDDRSLILRFYETDGKPCKVTVSLGFAADSYVETDLMENPIGEAKPLKRGKFSVSVGKCEIKTYRILRK